MAVGKTSPILGNDFPLQLYGGGAAPLQQPPHLCSVTSPSKLIHALSKVGQNLAWICLFDLGRREVEFAYILTGRNFSNIVTSQALDLAIGFSVLFWFGTRSGYTVHARQGAPKVASPYLSPNPSSVMRGTTTQKTPECRRGHTEGLLREGELEAAFLSCNLHFVFLSEIKQ